MTRTVAIVEDDPDQRQNCADALRRRGYRVQSYAGRREARAALSRSPPDLAILDIMLGVELDGGFDLCRELLAIKPHLPVIFLSSRADDLDRISGLRLGAWDYQTKPVSLAYLAERVSSVFRILDLRAAAATGKPPTRYGELAVDPERMEVRWRGRPVVLTYTQFNLLQAMLQRIDQRGVSYDDLAQATRQSVVENNTLNSHMLHIRARFREGDRKFDCIRNVYGFGYRWVCS